MKKMISFLMALCLLMSAPFAAMAQEIRPVIQDELPPVLVAVDGAFATILDAAGSVVAKAAEADALKLTDVHERTAEILPEVRERLLAAYLNLMSNVHFSDVASAIGLENLKQEIQQALQDEEITAYDLEMIEIFDVKMRDELAAVLTEDSVVEFSVARREVDAIPAMVAFSADGLNWRLLHDFTVKADGTVTLRIPAEGTVALLMNTLDETEPEDTEDPAVPQPDVPAKPNPNFTPSVYGKPAPSVVTTVDENGRTVVAAIKHTENKDVFPVYAEDRLVITPVAESPYTMDVTTHEHLQWSYDGILQAETVGHIRTGIGAEIDGILHADGFAHLTHFDMVVRDLFEVSIYGDHVEKFYDENAYLEIRFDVELAKGEPLVVIFSDDSHNWHVLPNSCMELSKDGVLTLKLSSMGTVAFLVEQADTLTQLTVKSPE